MKGISVFFVMFFAFGMFSCKTVSRVPDSNVEGHYENFSENEFKQYWFKQVLPAEYEPTQAVILNSELVFSFDKILLVKEILNAGAEAWIISRDRNIKNQLADAGLSPDEISRIRIVPADVLTIWTRDYAPLTAIPKESSEKALRLIDINYYDRRPSDDFLPQSIAQDYQISRISIPVYNEGGNIMCTNDKCFMTIRVTEANSPQYTRKEDVLSEDQIKDYYEKATSKKITIMPRLPTEGTGHIDMWAKFMSDKDVVVNEVWDETMDYVKGEGHKKVLLDVKTFLDARAADFTRMGYRVTRIPIPLPQLSDLSISERRYDDFRDGQGVFRSYTNGLILNGTYIIPRYKTLHGDGHGETGDYLDRDLTAKYESAVTERLAAIGISKLGWIDSDDTIAIGGAVHCTTMQIPRAN